MPVMLHLTCEPAEALVHRLPEGAIIITDPPYNQRYHYDVYPDNLTADDYDAMLRRTLGGRRVVVMHYPEEMFAVVAPACGRVRECMAWVYPSNQGKQHRLVCWFNCEPDWRRAPQPYKNPEDKRVKLLIEAGKQARGYDWVEVNHVKNVSKSGHPCPIPYEIAERLVLASTEPGGVVCDPFCGSGTVLLAALKNGRHAYGCDLSEAYVALARERLSDFDVTSDIALAPSVRNSRAESLARNKRRMAVVRAAGLTNITDAKRAGVVLPT